MEGPERRRQSLAAAAMGVEIVGDDRGMIPRAMEQIFQSVLSLHEDGWEVGLTCDLAKTCWV